ncbi:hypothetical protein LX32DRAFT_691941 [Colletotrichum zoysiae]|uniref:EthD domain-containing protein n=1 Tax=Colletotrichum zoysiae TaxID=1216348 RepID=A0AAD9HLG4_9PEZI|nr:hypothetical protein LX32DRAFT_691941 [Colletotrichum zoysiae]
MFMKKLPDITDEDFHAYWANNNVQDSMANSTFASKIRQYSQYHIRPELRGQAKIPGGTLFEFDGAAEFWVETLADWESIAHDPDFVRVVSDEMLNFVLEPLHVTLGYGYLVIGKDVDAAPAA